MKTRGWQRLEEQKGSFVLLAGPSGLPQAPQLTRSELGLNLIQRMSLPMSFCPVAGEGMLTEARHPDPRTSFQLQPPFQRQLPTPRSHLRASRCENSRFMHQALQRGNKTGQASLGDPLSTQQTRIGLSSSPYLMLYVGIRLD